MLSTINGGWHLQYYVLPIIVCATINNYLPIEDRYSGLICQHVIANILNISQGSMKSLHQPAKTHRLLGHFLNRHKVNKEAYDSIDAFIHQLK